MTKHDRVRDLLAGDDEYQDGMDWPWLSDFGGRPVDKRTANKFMLGAIMDYQMKADTVWENAARLSEDILGDPDDLWETISRKSQDDMARLFAGPPALHRFTKNASKRVLRIATDITTTYDGDARKIWLGQTTSETLRRLYELRVGEQISPMILGALRDSGQIHGKGPLKADLHVRRVLGRVFYGREATIDEALDAADKMAPGDSWRLDAYLYTLGQTVCKKQRPRCDECPLSGECQYRSKAGRDISSRAGGRSGRRRTRKGSPNAVSRLLGKLGRIIRS